jgi:outer membrane protein OmpU
MNNYKKIGLTALAASLVSVSANAGALTASGSASMNMEGHTGTGLNAPTTFSMANSVTMTGSGEMDNGLTVSVSFEMDQGTSNNSSLGFDSHSVTVSSDTMGTLTLAGHGGNSATTAIDTTAAGDMWDNFDGVIVLGGTTIADAAIGNGGVNNSLFYSSPDLMDGLNFTLSYDPQVEGTSGTGSDGQVGYGVNYSGVDGLTVSYATSDVNDHDSDKAGDNQVIKATYAYGPVTVGYSEMEHDEGASGGGNDTTITSYALTYTVSDELSVTYGTETSDRGDVSVDAEVEGIKVSYTTGGMTISANSMSIENGNYTTAAAEDADYWKLGASFAF